MIFFTITEVFKSSLCKMKSIFVVALLALIANANSLPALGDRSLAYSTMIAGSADGLSENAALSFNALAENGKLYQ